jgi:hypothetical protein
VAQQLYAKIKRSSKYEYQNKVAQENGYGLPFEVDIDSDKGGYVVKGGPGGQYQLADVQLFVKCDDGTDLRIA